MNGDRMTDYGLREGIQDTFGLSATALTQPGASTGLGKLGGGKLADAAAPAIEAAAPLAFTPAVAHTGDFNGDHRDDLLWRQDTGRLSDWLGTTSGGFSFNGGNADYMVSTSQQVVGIGDFNGDGKADIMWRGSDGHIMNWLGGAGGTFTDNSANASQNVTLDWNVAGIGDFNGDGRDDILWRNDDGRITDWLSTSNGGYAPNSGAFYTSVGTDWHVAAVGDFNGDGKDDILWRNDDGRMTDWLGTSTGAFTDNLANAYQSVTTDWHIVGVGDFNGDGKDDILWRNDDGRITDWIGTASGGFTPNATNFYTSVSTDWKVATIGDFNGDGKDDILFRNDDGRITDWIGTTTGSFVDNHTNSLFPADTHWQIQPVQDLL